MTTEQRDAQDLRQRYIEAMSFAPATVNIVTTDGSEGRAGVTVSAMASVSADADHPVLLVCVHENGVTAQHILGNGVFCVNILREHQAYISDVFAGRYNGTISDKFDVTTWEKASTGSPAIEDALAALDCRVSHIRKVGTHYVIFGNVHEIRLSGTGSALTYAKRGYTRVQPIEICPARSDVQETPLTLGCFHTFAPYLVPPIIRQLNGLGTAPNLNLVEGDGPLLELGLLNGEIDLAFIYGAEFQDGLRAEPVAALSPQVLLPADHALAKMDSIQPMYLNGESMISAVNTRASERVEQMLLSHGSKPNIVYRSSSLEMARSMVAQGLGFAIVTARIAGDREDNHVVSIPLEVQTEPARISLVQSADRKADPVDKHLLKLARSLWA
ncbi:MAG: LysR substrate-binding domain-containing protein [Pseudomonadota bacterium]